MYTVFVPFRVFLKKRNLLILTKTDLSATCSWTEVIIKVNCVNPKSSHIKYHSNAVENLNQICYSIKLLTRFLFSVCFRLVSSVLIFARNVWAEISVKVIIVKLFWQWTWPLSSKFLPVVFFLCAMSFFQKNCYFGFSKTIAEFDHLCLKTIAPATDDSNLQWLETQTSENKSSKLNIW